MKIGIDIQATEGPLTGLGVYTKNLVRALLEERRNGFEFTLLHKGRKGDLDTLRRILWESVEIPSRVRKNRIQLLHVPAFSAPLIKPCKVVVTVHDLIGMIFPNQLGWPSRFYWGRWLPMTVRRADALIADSENTKQDLIRLLGISPQKVTVIYPSGHEGFRPERDSKSLDELRGRFGIKEKYFLTVGTLEPRKNIIRIIQAFSKFVREVCVGHLYQLIIVGLTDFAHGKFVKGILGEEKVGEGSAVILTGYLKREDLNTLYSGAVAFLFPSLYEGFGIPVLEAMASGTPVLTSQISSLPEVAGEAAYYVDPYSQDEITEGMGRLCEEDLRRGLIQKGFQQIKNFSWRETARQTLEVYEGFAHG